MNVDLFVAIAFSRCILTANVVTACSHGREHMVFKSSQTASPECPNGAKADSILAAAPFGADGFCFTPIPWRTCCRHFRGYLKLVKLLEAKRRNMYPNQ